MMKGMKNLKEREVPRASPAGTQRRGEENNPEASEAEFTI